MVILIFSFSLSMAADVIKLPTPQTDGGKPLMQALKERRSERSFDAKKVPVNVLSNMLWAACGINRPAAGKRTAPSAMNRQQIDVYVATADGLYLYDAKGHALKPVLSQDIRALTGKQSFVAQAPVTLIYVADFKKWVIFPMMRKIFMPRPTRASSVRMSICSALRKVWVPLCGVL